MALLFMDGFDAYSSSQLNAKYNSITGTAYSFGGPGRLGYGQYVNVGGSSIVRGLSGGPYTSIISGAAFYLPNTTLPVIPGGSSSTGMSWQDINGVVLGSVTIGPLGQLAYVSGGGNVYQSATGLVNPQTWSYLEAQVTFSASGSGSVTVRLNGATVLSQASVTTAPNGNGCSGVVLAGLPGNSVYFDDYYNLSLTAPNNAFLGDCKVLPLYPIGNGRVDGFSRFGGSASGNYTAVGENPPDADTSYVYTATAGTEDCYTITALSNVTTIKATQVNAFCRKDDTPSRVLALGVGNGTTENFDSGQSVNTTYTYLLRQLDQNPLTSAAWAVADFSTLQLAQKLLS